MFELGNGKFYWSLLWCQKCCWWWQISNREYSDAWRSLFIIYDISYFNKILILNQKSIEMSPQFQQSKSNAVSLLLSAAVCWCLTHSDSVVHSGTRLKLLNLHCFVVKLWIWKNDTPLIYQNVKISMLKDVRKIILDPFLLSWSTPKVNGVYSGLRPIFIHVLVSVVFV